MFFIVSGTGTARTCPKILFFEISDYIGIYFHVFSKIYRTSDLQLTLLSPCSRTGETPKKTMAMLQHEPKEHMGPFFAH